MSLGSDFFGQDKESPRKKKISSQPRMTCLCAVRLEKCFVHTCIVTLSHLDGAWGQCSPCLQLTDVHENDACSQIYMRMRMCLGDHIVSNLFNPELG